MAVSSRDVNVKEGKMGKEKTKMERKLASMLEEEGETNTIEIIKLLGCARLCNSNPAIQLGSATVVKLISIDYSNDERKEKERGKGY